MSMVLVSLRMEILLTSVTSCGLRCRLISSREHDARSGDFITPFEKFRVGFMFSFPNCFHFSIFSDCFFICYLYNNGVVHSFFDIDWFTVCFIVFLN